MSNPHTACVVFNERGQTALVCLSECGAQTAVSQIRGAYYTKVPCAHAEWRVTQAVGEAGARSECA